MHGVIRHSALVHVGTRQCTSAWWCYKRGSVECGLLPVPTLLLLLLLGQWTLLNWISHFLTSINSVWFPGTLLNWSSYYFSCLCSLFLLRWYQFCFAFFLIMISYVSFSNISGRNHSCYIFITYHGTVLHFCSSFHTCHITDLWHINIIIFHAFVVTTRFPISVKEKKLQNG